MFVRFFFAIVFLLFELKDELEPLDRPISLKLAWTLARDIKGFLLQFLVPNFAALNMCGSVVYISLVVFYIY